MCVALLSVGHELLLSAATTTTASPELAQPFSLGQAAVLLLLLASVWRSGASAHAITAALLLLLLDKPVQFDIEVGDEIQRC